MFDKKNILILTREIPPMVGGAGVVAWQNATTLARLGHSVTLLTVGSPSISLSAADLKVISVPALAKTWVLAMGLRLKHLPLNNYDSIILNDIGAALVFALFFNNSPVLSKSFLYLHGGEVQKVINQPGILFRIVGFRKRYLNLLRRCHAVIAVSAYIKEYFLEFCSKEVASQKIRVTYAGIDEEIFYPRNTNLHAVLGVTRDRTLLLTVSRITKNKGFATMLDIFGKLIARDPDFHWIIVGDGPYLPHLERKVAEQKLSDHVTITGALPRSELPHYYSGAALYWLLSEREAFGLVYAEAQACGTPVIGLRRDGAAEAVLDGVSGFLIDEPQTCVKILSDRKYLSFDKDKIVAFARKFHLSRQGKILESELVVGNHRGL